MTDEDLYTYGALALAVGFLAWWQRDTLVQAGDAAVGFVVDLTQRGDKLTDTSTNVDGNIAEEPQDLANAASDVLGFQADLDTYSAARMVRSEEGSLSPDVRALLVHVAINDAAALGGWTLTHLMTYSTNPDNNGIYGAQYGQRRYSTAQDPYTQDYGIAQQVIASRAAGGADPTRGATKFFNRGVAMNPVPASWVASGYQPEQLDPAPDRLVFFRKA